MFETIIASFIKRYVSRYIDINADQLSAQLLYKQQIIIENLTLNKTTVNEDIHTILKLPIKIESIHIDKIQCSFVWSSLFFRSSSAAMIIKIEGIHAVIIENENEFLIETIEENNQNKKRNQLDLIEQQLEKEFECFGEVKSSRWNIKRLFMSFFEKLQIEIIDIHISYKNSTFYTIGLTCDSIQISNEPSNEAISRQIFRIVNPGFYIDINNPSTHSYILSPPISMEIYLIHNHFLINQKEYCYEFQCTFNDLNMKCNNEQVRILTDIIRSIQHTSLHRMLISDSNRPHSKISKQTAKAWWRYTILAVLRTQIDSKNLTINFWFDRSLLIYRLHQLITYKHLYRAYLDKKYGKYSNFSFQDELTMNNIEIEFNIKHLIIIRRSIFQMRINEQLNDKKQETIGWYSNYAKWITSKVIELWERMLTSENMNTNLNENDLKFQEQVTTFIAESIEDEDLAENCHNSLIFRFKFTLKSVQIDLLSSNNTILFNFYLKNLSLMTEFRLRHQSILTSIYLEDLYLRDQEQIDKFSKMICSKERSQQDESQQLPIFQLTFEKKIKSKSLKQSIYSIDIRSCGLRIVCCPESIERLYHFYLSAFSQFPRSLSSTFYNWKQIKNYVVQNLMSVLEPIIPTHITNNNKVKNFQLQNFKQNQHREKKIFHTYVNIGAPEIIIPLLSHDTLIIDLGCLILTNDSENKSDTVTSLINTAFTQQQFQENDDEAFLTPDSSPEAIDNLSEVETTFYSINIIPTDQIDDHIVEYSTLKLSINDIQIGYSTDFSQIVERFSVYFVVQHRVNHLWPLVNISGTLQKIIVHLNSEKIQNLCCTINPWITFIDNFVTKSHYQLNIWPVLNLHLDEINILLNDKSQILCDIHIQNIDLSLINTDHSKNLTFILQTLTIFDCIQKIGENYEILLKTNQVLNVNEPFIRANIHFLTKSQISECNSIIDINTDKLDFVFNSKTICTLVNFLLDINLFSWNRTILKNMNNLRNSTIYKINGKFREINVLFISITPNILPTEVHVRNIFLNILLNPFSKFEITLSDVQIFNQLNTSQQSSNALIIDDEQINLILDISTHSNNHEESQNTALHLLLINTNDNDYNLSIKIISISYFHSLNMIYNIQQILNYINQHCHLIVKQKVKRENEIIWLFNHFTHLIKFPNKSIISSHQYTLSIDLHTLTVIFPMNIIIQLDKTHIKNGHDQSSDYEINIDRINLLPMNFTDEIRSKIKMNYIHRSQHLFWQFLENISMSVNLQLSDGSIMIDSKLISPLRIFLSQNRIKYVEEILKAISPHNTTLLSKFTFHLLSFQMIIIFQTDHNYELMTICEAILDQCQISYEQDYPYHKRIALQFDSLQIKDRLINFEEYLIVLKFPSLIELNIRQVDNQHQQFNVKFGKINIKFVKLTWIILLEIIEIFHNEIFSSKTTEIQNKEQHIMSIVDDSMDISINIDSISCLFQDDLVSLMNIDLQRFVIQIQTCSKQSVVSLIINSQLGFISIHDLLTSNQFYNERLCTTGTNAIVFSFTTKENSAKILDTNYSIHPQLHLRLTSIQYIHTQYFLLNLIDFLNRFRQNGDFYNRLQTLVIKPIISNTVRPLNEILWNTEIENMILILPEDILKKSVFIFQLDYINFNNHFLFQNKSKISNTLKDQIKKVSRLDFISIEIKNIEFYSTYYCLFNENISTSIRFSKFGFSHTYGERLSMVRERFHLNIKIEHNLDKSINNTSPTYIIKMNLSSIDILFDLNQYRLIQNIIASNLNEESTIMINNLFNSLLIVKNDVYVDFAVIIEIDHVGLEIFVFDIDLLSSNHRRSLGSSGLTNLHISFDHYFNGNQSLHLFASTIQLLNTQISNGNMIISLSMPSNSSQIEIHLSKTKLDKKCTITLNSVRFLLVVDWLLELNEFLNSFYEQQSTINTSISIISFDIKLDLNQFELVFVPSIKDPYANALVYSSTMILHYKKGIRPLKCSITDLTFFTCQIGCIDETTMSIIEPIDCSFNVYISNEMLNEQTCKLNIPILNIRLSYSNIKIILSLVNLIYKQISQAKTRKPLLTYFTGIIISPLKNYQSSENIFLNIKFLKFICDEICLCLIDDCFGVNIPLLNINLKFFNLQTIENNDSHRTDQSEFQLSISYYNRFQSGFEPLIEICQLQMIFSRSSSSSISLFISSNEILNLNFTKAIYRLYNTIKTNWLIDYQNSKNDITMNISKKEIGFHRVKPLDSYCFKNLTGVQIKFRTWITAEQRFTNDENIVDDNQTISFCFPTRSSELNKNINQHSKMRARTNSIVASLFQTDRRLLISIDGWQCLQPISIDRIGKFFRLAIPSNHNQLVKPILVTIDIAMTDNSIRSITVKSSIEIRNQLLTSIDIRFECNFDLSYEFCLEPNEIRSLPIQFCSILKQIQVRPANFALDYCDDPINWLEIENENTIGVQRNDNKSSTRKSSTFEENTINRQSFLRRCSINGKEAVYYVCFQSKQTCLLTYQDHTFSLYELSIFPPLTIYNLLPCTLNFEIPSHPQKFELSAYKFHKEHVLNIAQGINIIFATNLYHMNKPICLPSINDLHRMKYTHQRIIFYDNSQRELIVDITIVCIVKYRLKLFVSVPYVLLNKSGIPLIFKDINSRVEAAGQNKEDEIALNREPLLFSFNDSNRNNTCVMRVGTGLHLHQDGRPQWSQRFSLEHGSTYRQLKVRLSRNSSDWNYSISIDVHSGHGHLKKKTKFIFFNARYIICNQSSYDLLIAQRHIVDNTSNWLHVLQHANVAYHWPRTDIEQLLCVRVMDDDQYPLIHWSGGFQIDSIDAFHINMRYENGQCLILRVQVIERNGTYFVVFMDSNQMPVPFRIYNRSDVPIQFYQTETREDLSHLRTIIQPHQSIDYAWDEPTFKPTITCSIIDGTKATYDLLKLGSADDLHYQNYIYLTFEETFHREDLTELLSTTNKANNISHSSYQQLVIEYIDGRLLLSKLQENKRSQLWQMTSNGLLIHVGSSPSSFQDSNTKKEYLDDIRHAFVLDIKDSTDNVLSHLMTRSMPLIVRRYDSKRAFTQTWQFLDNGCLCMANTQMCVQVFGELNENSDVVLGPIIENKNLLPAATMHIRSYQRYKGSGVLYTRVIADGPTNVLEIDHIKTTDSPIITTILSSSSTIYHLDLHFPFGVGISVVGSIGHESEELIYVLVNNVHIEYNDKDHEQSIEATIDTLIISNQLLTTTKPCLLYASYTKDPSTQSAIRLQVNWKKFNANFILLRIIRYLRLDLNSIVIQLDELLLWKLIDFFDIEISSLSALLFKAAGIGNSSNSDRKIDLNVNDYDTERILSLLTSTHATRIYFNKLYLSPINLKLSVYCIHSKRLLPMHLLAIKRRASFPLVPFENAEIHLRTYEQTHISNTYDFFLFSIMTHYVNVCTRQILKIVGSVDFLGNPLGLIHDVTNGLTCLVDQGSVSGLVKNVTHGVADSTSKVTGSLSHGLGKLVSDNETDSRRQAIADHRRGSTLGHAIRHGTVGLAAGFYGGLTSMIKQPYKGVVEEGVPGLVKGVAKGIVGTVSKPMVGILDFTNEMATAIKEGSRSSNTNLHSRTRPIRWPSNSLCLLQSYSIFDAQGHYLLYKINKGNMTERYISRLTLSTKPTNMSDKRVVTTNSHRNKFTSDRRDAYVDAMITTQRVIIYQRIGDEPDIFKFEIINSYDFSTSMTVVPIEDDDGHTYIRFLIDSNTSTLSNNTSNISHQCIHRCDTLDQAKLFIHEVQRAQEIFQEEKMIYVTSDDEYDDIYSDNLNDQQTE
ncbi:unnamed protein product [Rotaria sordida]|uniref:Vacuolar protein sorting-associated protein 13 VPS13 adaptor binding domain-containing protein n=1 Tax=Rotaria sordida TaxID=392033 RepID=A0A819E417_9BILA|nr:unnamed protein product [Rotaria sordida]